MPYIIRMDLRSSEEETSPFDIETKMEKYLCLLGEALITSAEKCPQSLLFLYLFSGVQKFSAVSEELKLMMDN